MDRDTRRPRGWRFDLIPDADHQSVGKIDAGGPHPNAHLMRLQLRVLRLFAVPAGTSMKRKPPTCASVAVKQRAKNRRTGIGD
jgi:hypothetical protein